MEACAAVRTAASQCAYGLSRVRSAYRSNSDLAASVTNVGLNTILFASKLFKEMPPLIPRLAFTALSFTGMISLNMQANDWSKHLRDCRFAWHFRTYPAFALTTARVAVKGTNILLTCSLFAGAIIALVGFPAAAAAMFAALRPVAMAALAGTISGEFIDYNANSRARKKLRAVRLQEDADPAIRAVAQQFIMLAYQPPFGKMDARIRPDTHQKREQRLAVEVVRQLEVWSLDSIKAGLAAQGIGRHSVLTQSEAVRLYGSLEMALQQAQAMTKANIGLTTLGYISMGLCRLYPQTLLQYGLTLAMSLFYTGKMVIEKYLLNLLKKRASLG